MITVSLCMIVRDEAEELERLMKTCGNLFDEVVIVDMGSSDQTYKTAQLYGDKVSQKDFTGSFSEIRNYSFSKAACDYIMWLDAGDLLEPEELRNLNILKKTLPRDVDGVMMRCVTQTDETGKPLIWHYRQQMVRRNAAYQWIGETHETLEISGVVRESGITVIAKNRRPGEARSNLEIFNGLNAKGAPFSQRDTLFYARDLRDNGLLQEASGQFEKAAYMEGNEEDRVSACFEASFCFQQLHEDDRAMDLLLDSFRFSLPRPEICCRIGDFLYAAKAYREASFWYELSLKLELPAGTGYRYSDYHGYVPALQLCLCAYYLGNLEKAVEFNELAGKFKPGNESVKSNNRFFSSLRKEKRKKEKGLS